MNTLVTFNPMTVAPEDSLAKVLRLMALYEMHHVPVVDDDFHLLGIISDADVAECLNNDFKSSPDEHGFDVHLPLPSAAAVMTGEVISLDVDLAPLVALQAILRHGFHSIPVTSAGRLRGIITATDFLREIAALAPRTARSPIARLMSPWRPTIGDESSPAEAGRQLAAHQVRYLGVHDGARAVGVVSARMLRRVRRLDLVADEAVEGDNLLLERSTESVGALLSGALAVIGPLHPVAEAASLLLELKVDGLAVVGGDNKVVGMLTESDILRTISLELARLA